MSLEIKACSYHAAKYAVENYHYSRTMPRAKLLKFGIWEDGKFIGVVIYGCGANNHISLPFGLKITKICELVRIAIREHVAPVSRIVSITNRVLKKLNPGIKLVISYADPEQNHLGIIYQAANWIYLGRSGAQRACLVGGNVTHKRAVSLKRGTIKGVAKSAICWKHKYAYPLNSEMRELLKTMAKPYPKELIAAAGETGPGVQSE